MKYGLLINRNCENIGDDIQAYAEAQFLPRVDVMIDRENLDIFKYGDGTEPVALIMGAWFMWKKYNWPPSKQIVPLMVGYHHFQREKNLKDLRGYAIPIFDEHYSGIGGQWLKDYGPVGCRDEYTCEVLDKCGIPNYFSGCVTLTLPKQKKTKDAGTYVCLVDLNDKVEKKVRSLIGDKYKIKKFSHTVPRKPDATWEEKAKDVEEILTIYQNAKYVVTRRLHVALPCLAMGVPVLVIQSYKMNDPHRFEPYRDWLHYCRNNDFLKNGYPGFDFENGTPNKENYLETSKKIRKTMEDFVNYCEKNKNKPLDFFDKTTYSEEELLRWRVDFMRETLQRTHVESNKLFNNSSDINKRSLFYIIAKQIYNRRIVESKYADSKFVSKLKNKVKKKK